MSKFGLFLEWYKYTSFVVGVPITFVLLFMGMQKFVFTAGCMTAGWKCEYAFGVDEAFASYMGDLLMANPGSDIEVRSKSRK